MFGRYDLTPQQYNALRLLRAEHPGTVPTLVLANRLVSRAPDITRLLDKLEQRGLVARYRPGGDLARAKGWGPGVGVRAWQVGNEPNLPNFWRGTPADYVRLLEVAALVIRWLDPAATIVHNGQSDGLVRPVDPQLDARAGSGVPEDVRQRLLHDAERRELHRWRNLLR